MAMKKQRDASRDRSKDRDDCDGDSHHMSSADRRLAELRKEVFEMWNLISFFMTKFTRLFYVVACQSFANMFEFHIIHCYLQIS